MGSLLIVEDGLMTKMVLFTFATLLVGATAVADTLEYPLYDQGECFTKPTDAAQGRDSCDFVVCIDAPLKMALREGSLKTTELVCQGSDAPCCSPPQVTRTEEREVPRPEGGMTKVTVPVEACVAGHARGGTATGERGHAQCKVEGAASP